MSLGEGRVGSRRPALLRHNPCKEGSTNPRPLQAGLFRDPRGQGHELKVHDRVRREGTLANPGERIKNSEALTSSPTPFRKHRRSKEKKKKRGVRKSRRR